MTITENETDFYVWTDGKPILVSKRPDPKVAREHAERILARKAST